MATGDYGEPANVWNDFRSDPEADGVSGPVFDLHLGNEFQIFGSAEGAYLMRLQFSQDGVRWYNGPSVEPDDDGHFDFRESGVQARYVRLQALRGPDFAVSDDEGRREPMVLNATLVAKTTR